MWYRVEAKEARLCVSLIDAFSGVMVTADTLP